MHIANNPLLGLSPAVSHRLLASSGSTARGLGMWSPYPGQASNRVKVKANAKCGATGAPPHKVAACTWPRLKGFGCHLEPVTKAPAPPCGSLAGPIFGNREAQHATPYAGYLKQDALRNKMVEVK